MRDSSTLSFFQLCGFCFVFRLISCIPSRLQTHYVVESGLEIEILWSQPLKYWDYRCAPCTQLPFVLCDEKKNIADLLKIKTEVIY